MFYTYTHTMGGAKVLKVGDNNSPRAKKNFDPHFFGQWETKYCFNAVSLIPLFDL